MNGYVIGQEEKISSFSVTLAFFFLFQVHWRTKNVSYFTK